MVSISDSDLVELSDAFDWGFFGLMNSGGHLFGKTAVIGRSSVQRPEIVITDSGGPRSDTPGSEHRKANLKSGHGGGSTPVPGRDAVPPACSTRSVFLRGFFSDRLAVLRHQRKLDRRHCAVGGADLNWVNEAIEAPSIAMLENGTFTATVRGLRGVIGTGATLEACRGDLTEVIEEWVLVRVARGLSIPALDGA